MINSQKALNLYILLRDHFPQENNEFDIVQLIRIIINSMADKGQHVNYHRSLMLMYDLSLDVIASSDPQDLLTMFAEGIVENNVIELMSFFRNKVRYGIS